MVLLPVTVFDPEERLVTGLNASAFEVFEDKKQREIEYFSTQDLPLSITLVLDLSGSMANKFDVEREAISQFYANANARDEYSVITFADNPHVVAHSMRSLDAIEASLDGEKPHGNTSLIDAVWSGADLMRTAEYERRYLLLITDGGDNYSRHSMHQLVKKLEESNVEVYAIGIFDSGAFKTVEEAMGRRWLRRITDATGGRTVGVEKDSEVAAVAAGISREMREEYVLGWRPGTLQTDPERRKVRVTVVPPRGSAPLRAYYKTGYSVDANGSR
jgi:Ca-activated chloride channel family protein